MDGSISFDSNSLQTYVAATRVGIITESIDLESIPEKDISLFSLAHANRSSIPFVDYPSKIIAVTGSVISDTPTNLGTLLDTFRGYFTGQDKNLDIGYKGGTRRYIATASKLDIVPTSKKTYVKFSLEFTCTVPFGQDTSATTAWSASAQTAATGSHAHTFLGTAPWQTPVITITLNTLTLSGTTGTFVFGNQNTGQAVSVTRAFVATDVLQIDTDPSNKTPVTINGVPIDFDGGLPQFGKGPQTMYFQNSSFSAINFNVAVSYKPLYL